MSLKRTDGHPRSRWQGQDFLRRAADDSHIASVAALHAAAWQTLGSATTNHGLNPRTQTVALCQGNDRKGTQMPNKPQLATNLDSLV